MTDVLECPPVTQQSKKKTGEKSTTAYQWQPLWHCLDDEDICYFLCLIDIKITNKQYKDKEFPFRLKRQFTKQQKGWRFDGRIDSFEAEDITYLASLLDITIPREEVEKPSFPKRQLAHLVEDEKSGDYKFDPYMKILDEYDIPLIISFYKFEMPEGKLNTIHPGLKRHFKKVGASNDKR